MNLIKPKEITLKDMDGEKRTFMISRVPANVGRELFTQYIPTALPKVGDYKANEALMKKLMSYVSAKTNDGSYVALSNDVLINSHIPDWELLITLEKEMVSYNTNFFNPEKLSKKLSKFNQTLPERITQMLTRLSEQLSAKSKRP